MKHQPESCIIGQTAASATNSSEINLRRFYPATGKRGLDILLVLFALPLILPLIAILALLVMMDGAAPFFGHKRIGRNGKEFRCWKLRSMVPDAEARLLVYLASDPVAQREWTQNFKLEKDPRITRLGNILRKTSLDELPQILNILKGEMSFVGPRPVTAKEMDFYGTASAQYQSVRPGLTGLWQVSGRNDISYADRVALDVRYARDCSMMMDIGVFLRTVGAIVGRTGR